MSVLPAAPAYHRGVTTDAAVIALPPRVRAFLEPPRFASLATLDADGTPRQTVVWYLLDGDDLVVNSLVGRRWPANLLRDARVALSVVDQANGYRWIGL